eukprot:TRINITY_DN447_c0_g1_i6.p1 TRINITY_DN447_c0_g1~~TRINITY_DN447_c0_g1_i6.p1  ORF type:complete len:331 (-),score=68.13 TRINITY_DN447_c0_g1_i6:191-1183(-)
MGNRSYASKIVEFIDPEHKIFKKRIISKDDTPDSVTGANQIGFLKKMFPHMGDDSMVVIVDDREEVWDFSPNLVQIPPFHYFMEDVPGLVPTHTDNPSELPLVLGAEKDTYLGSTFQKLAKIHSQFYNATSPTRDVRTIVAGMKSKILAGVHIVFSSVIPMSTDSTKFPLWKQATAAGAVCHETFSEEITHVVAARPSTEKVNKALHTRNVFLVTPNWLTDSLNQWQRQNELRYPLHNLPVVYSQFSFGAQPPCKRRKCESAGTVAAAPDDGGPPSCGEEPAASAAAETQPESESVAGESAEHSDDGGGNSTDSDFVREMEDALQQATDD